MPITDRQRELRNRHLGSSDAAAILGLSPWASPMDIFMEKVHHVAPLPPTPAMEIGNIFERAILDWTLKQLDGQLVGVVRRNQRRVSGNEVMAANIDCVATIDGRDLPVEVKFSSQPGEWGPESDGFEGVPVQYAPQTLHQMAVMGATRGYLGVFLTGFRPEFRLYDLRPPAEQIADLIEFEVGWWKKHIEGELAPTNCEPASIETIRRVIRPGGKTITISDALVEAWREREKVAKEAASEAADAKARVLTSLGDADAGECSMGTVTFREQTRNAFVTAESTFRVCRFTPSKAGKVGAA